MTDAPKRTIWPIVAAALIALPFLYVASIGPAAYLVTVYSSGLGVSPLRVADAFYATYAPLLLAADAINLRGVLDAYTKWWVLRAIS